MFAIVTIGGNQYRVSPGQKIVVDQLAGKVGDTVQFPALLVVSNEKQVQVGVNAAGTPVTAKIVQFLRGEKIDVGRFHHKTRHRRHIGFRADLTELTIEAIGAQAAATTKSSAGKTVKSRITRKTTNV